MGSAAPKWPLFHQVVRQAERMDRIMRRLGVDTIEAVRGRGAQSFAEARLRCLSCHKGAACERLANSLDPISAPPSGCPNTDYYLDLRERCIHS